MDDCGFLNFDLKWVREERHVAVTILLDPISIVIHQSEGLVSVRSNCARNDSRSGSGVATRHEFAFA